MSCTSQCNNKCNCTPKKDYSKPIACSAFNSLTPIHTYSPDDALKNLDIIGNTYCSWKESILDFVSKTQGLYNALVLESNPTRATITSSIDQYTALQKGFLNELKLLGNSKLTDDTNSLNTVISTNTISSSLDQNTPDNYFKTSAGAVSQKKVYSRKFYVKFTDSPTFHLITIPSFTFNYDKDIDAIAARVNYSDDITEGYSYTVSTENTKFYIITPDTKDGYFYENSDGTFVADLSDNYTPSTGFDQSISNLAEFYESIFNYTDPKLVAPNTDLTALGTDIKLFLQFLDLSILKINKAKTTINLKKKILSGC